MKSIGAWTRDFDDCTLLSESDLIRVCTEDKFKGQEAPVFLISMTAPSAEETLRGMEFLFSLNRINAAVSCAKGLAMVFGSPRLRQAKCDTIERMRLVNTLCALLPHALQ